MILLLEIWLLKTLYIRLFFLWEVFQGDYKWILFQAAWNQWLQGKNCYKNALENKGTGEHVQGHKDKA